ncbi:MAG: ATP-binding cassette domain-containing protein [Firmicutes bacterium]|nr:ATP-binding cassette domain-containing protein [Bacillota bacterium]
MSLFEFKDLNFTYPLHDQPALKHISFTVDEGEFLVISGKSGCGKSTLLRHFKTAITPYGKRSGQILFEGRELSGISVREQASRIGFVLQSPDNQIVTDKVWHELAFGMENLGYDPQVIRLRVAEMASFFGIQSWFMKNVDELSGGQKQILNLASVMTMQPDILLLDEPTSQLDPLAAGEFLTTLRKINMELGTTIVLVEHRLEEVVSYADRLMVMEGGNIIALDSPDKMGSLLKGHDMFHAMPVPMRIFDALDGTGHTPVTVKEGREWLESRITEGAKDQEDPVAFLKDALSKVEDGDSEPKDTILEAHEVWFKYEKDLPDVVQDLNFKASRGQLTCILGGNGTGKTTTLSILGGLLRPYRGKILIDGKPLTSYGKDLHTKVLGILPQNPQSLFVKDTVMDDLLEMLERPSLKSFLGNSVTDNELRAKAERVAELMEISDKLDSHPYDLSGGEQQRAALAKILLLDPKILLLDEPTKGIDGFYKKKLADIFQKLKADGKTLIMVSHDIEFCAEHGDVCHLFFNGNIVTGATARRFFAGNSFYTTASNRMARKWMPDAVTAEDVIEGVRALDKK